MTMQGQGESQPGDSEASLADIGSLFDAEVAVEDEQRDEVEDEATDEPEVDEADEDAEEAADKPADDPTVTITHDGKEVTLKQSEALALAQQGFDYTKKTQALAEDRKAAEAEKAKAAEYRQQHEKAASETLDRLTAFRDYVKAQVGDPPPVEWAATDAGYYLAQKEVYEQRKGQLQQAEAAIAHLSDERQRTRQAHLAATAQASIEALRGTLPGFTDSTLPELELLVHGYGLSLVTASDGYVQNGLWELAHKAKAYDALQAEKAKLKPVKEMPKVSKPSASNPPSNNARAERSRVEAHQKRPSLATLGALFGD
jgi:hypothetical protein